MASNPTLFPPDFPTELLGNSSDTFSLENAVVTLQIQARDTAVKEALSRKIAGQNSISNQNRAVAAITTLMPLTYVGAVVQATPFLGTAGYLGGGRGHGSNFISVYRVLFSNEIFVKSGVRLTGGRIYSGTLGDARSGYFCGGSTSFFSVDQLFYLREAVARTGLLLSTGRYAQAGGKGDKVKGFLTGGANASGNVVRVGDKLTYASNTMTGLGNFLSSPRLSAHNGISSKTFGYDCGGLSQSFSTLFPPIFTVERISYAAETSASIATTLPHAHVIHGAASYDVKSYLAGGNTNQPASWNWFTTDITSFTFSGETAVLISAKLADGKTCLDGTGSSAAAYFFGGDTVSSNWKGTQTADKLTFSTESCIRMGSQLSDPLADQGAVSNYGSGFSH